MVQVFSDYIMQEQYEELCKFYGDKKAYEMVMRQHEDYFGTSARFYGIQSKKEYSDE